MAANPLRSFMLRIWLQLPLMDDQVSMLDFFAVTCSSVIVSHRFRLLSVDVPVPGCPSAFFVAAAANSRSFSALASSQP